MTRMDVISSFQNEYLTEKMAYFNNRKAAPEEYALCRVLQDYFRTNEHGLTAFTIEDMVWESDFDAYMEELEKAGIRELHLCDTSTALMRSIHLFLGAGWQIAGPYTQRVSSYTTLEGLTMKKA